MVKNGVKISETEMICTEAEESRSVVRQIIDSMRDLGQAEAFHRAHRETGFTVRRLQTIYRGHISRIWADEYSALKRWHDEWRERQITQLRHQAAILEAQTAARRQSECDG